MKCTLRNTCSNREWCCNYCTLKCDMRCKDDHTDCMWFIDEPIVEEEEE